MNKTLIAFLGFFIITYTSCNDEYTICNTSKTVNVISNFYQVNGNVETAVPVPSLKLSNSDGLLIFNNPVSTPAFSLTLNPALDSISYILGISALPADTLTLVYTSQNVIISEDCGNVNEYQLTTVRTTTHTIDSVKIINPLADINAAQI